MNTLGIAILAVMQTNMNAVRYTELLEEYLLPFSSFVHDISLFMLDNLAVYTAHTVKEWFKESGTAILQRPAKSSNLNPIENI